jgi:hypothetical protein
MVPTGCIVLASSNFFYTIIRSKHQNAPKKHEGTLTTFANGSKRMQAVASSDASSDPGRRDIG